MKIIQALPFIHPVEGGLEGHVFSESIELAGMGHKVTVYTSDSKRIGKGLPKKEIIDGITIKRFNTWCRFSYFTPFFPRAYWAALFDDYDVMSVHSYRQPLTLCMLFAKLRGKKNVFTTHWPEYPEELRSKVINIIIPIFDKTLGKFLMKFSDRFITQSVAEKNWLIEDYNIKPETIDVIFPGIEKHYLKKANGNNFRKKYKIKGPMVLSLCRVHKSKGIDKIIKIAPSIKATFVIAGSGPHLEEFKKQAKGIKNIIFTGRVSEKEKLEAMAACEIFCSGTNYEAFGITFAEAMAQGAPLVGSAVGAVPETIGNCGYTFERNNLEEFKEKINKLLKNKKLRNEFSKRGQIRAKELTKDKISKQLETTFNLCFKK